MDVPAILHQLIDQAAEMLKTPARDVQDPDPLAESWQQQIERRLSACESNAAELGQLRNAINQHEAGLREQEKVINEHSDEIAKLISGKRGT